MSNLTDFFSSLLEALKWQPVSEKHQILFAVALGDWDKAVGFGTAAIAPMVAELNNYGGDNYWHSLVKALVNIGPAAVMSVAATLKNKNQHVRETAARVLGQIGDARAVEALIAGIADKDAGVRVTIIASLGKIKDARAAETLVKVLNKRLLSPPEVRRAAATALGEIGDRAAIAPLSAAIKDPDPALQVAAIVALGKIRDRGL